DPRGAQALLAASPDLGEEDLAAVALDEDVAQHHSMTFFSIGSTVTPCSRSHAIASSIAASVPSSSMAIIPTSSETLAPWMLNTRSKSREMRQMSGSRTSFFG